MAVDTFSEMQTAELDWWRNYLASPLAAERMYALYGSRYYDFFWHEFWEPGRTVEYGSGPLPVLALLRFSEALAVDTLWPQYQEIWEIKGLACKTDAADVPDGAYDTALLLNVLDHTDDPQRLVDHAYRSLADGGRALVFVHLNQEDPKHRLVTENDARGWFKDWKWARWQLKATPYDPVAFMAVYEK